MASDVPLLRNSCSYLSFSFDGNTCFSLSSYVHFKSSRYLLFNQDNLFNRKCYSSFYSEETFFINLTVVDYYPVITLVPLDLRQRSLELNCDEHSATMEP